MTSKEAYKHSARTSSATSSTTTPVAAVESPSKNRPRRRPSDPSPSEHNASSTLRPTTPDPRSRRDPLRRVQLVGRHAALTTKQVVWDSNDASIDAALSAVDHWEGIYNALRGLLVASFQSARGIYGAAKEGAGKIEHGFLMPVRDWIILPAFFGAEQAAIGTASFLQSQQARELAGQTLEMTKRVPVVGENFLAPAMCFSVGFLQRSWEIAQYPIPSKEQVRHSVDFALNGTKWALSTGFREILLYIQRADANITRTLSHTQWKVLGSGPYATLDKNSKSDVINHICERYFSTKGAFARYELASHIRTHNRTLYNDLVLTGLLKERGGDLTSEDEWLSSNPDYRDTGNKFLLDGDMTTEVASLWFRLPNVNGNRPGKDAPWVCFRRKEQYDLEERYRQILGKDATLPEQHSEAASDNTERERKERYPAIAQWYDPNAYTDLLVDENRYAVSFFVCCTACRRRLPDIVPPEAPRNPGDICKDCSGAPAQQKGATYNVPSFEVPSLAMLLRPTFWRFHGPGDEVRRASWFLDTARNGLQPFDEGAQAILEDAYLFLSSINAGESLQKEPEIDRALLTVEVPCPDGSVGLVQFSSLTHATAIQQGLTSAVALFKRRVYRGAWLGKESPEGTKSLNPISTLEDNVSRAIEENGTLGDTLVPDVCIRSLLSPAASPNREKASVPLDPIQSKECLAVPPSRLRQDDMAKQLVDHGEREVDHMILVVHGIGEMMRAIDVFGLSLANLSATLIDCCDYLRKNHVEVNDAQPYEAVTRSGRVEYLPVEWHEAFTILSQRRPGRPRPGQSRDGGSSSPNVMLKDISLKTIPHMRDFANDTLMDVLYFMNPQHHDIIVDVVVNEMNVVVKKFKQLTNFKGRISIIGHSLGSIITWDILSNQEPKCTEEGSPVARSPKETSFARSLSGASITSSASQVSEITDACPELTPARPDQEPTAQAQLDFAVDNLFLLGSPVSVFLMIRNQRAPLSDDFYLPGCSRVFNIFHPFDPVAYRIEPCLDPRNADFEPSIMRHWNGGLRVQYQTKRLWRQLVDTTRKTQQDFVEALEAGVAGMGLLRTSEGSGDEEASSEYSLGTDALNNLREVKTGSLNRGARIDYMIQEKGIESANEYVAALAAHSCYWIEKDLSLFINRQIYESTLERMGDAGR